MKGILSRSCFARFFVLTVSLICLFAPYLSATYDYEYEGRGHFETEMAMKFQRGVTNAGLGWVEIFQTPVRWSKDPRRGFLSTSMIGVPYGIVRGIGRTVVGVYEVATCYAPQKPIFSELEGDVY